MDWRNHGAAARRHWGLQPAPLIQCTIWRRTVAISSNNFQAAYRIR
ncbi:hypothetical protein [Kingella oralis]